MGKRGERADQMSKPLEVSSCQLTYLDLPGMLAPKDCVLNSSFGTNPGKSSIKTFGDLQEQEASGSPGMGTKWIFTQLRGWAYC